MKKRRRAARIAVEPKFHRCSFCGSDPIYVSYHDLEWGVPEFSDQALFEKLVLDGFQAGLSWIIVLKKREHFRKALDGFDANKMARYTRAKIEKLKANPNIIRNTKKIDSVVTNARAYLAIQENLGSFAKYIWSFVDGVPIQNHWKQEARVPALTKESIALAKDLKQHGFRFCGPTIVYAFMQAVGMVNDHVITCFRHNQIQQLAKPFKLRLG